MTNAKDWKKFDIAYQCENKPKHPKTLNEKMKYTNPDFKNFKKDYQDFIGVSENFIKELKKKELINETINHPKKK